MFIAILAMTLPAPVSPQDQPLDIPASVRDALEGNADALSPTTVQWELTYASPVPLTELVRRISYPFLDTALLAPKQVVFRWDRGKAYSHYTERFICIDEDTGEPLRDKPLDRRNQEMATDLHNFFVGTGIENINMTQGVFPILRVEPLDRFRLRQPERGCFRPEYFFEAGFKLPCTGKEIGTPAISLPLYVLANGGRVDRVEAITLDGVACLMLELTAPMTLLRGWTNGCTVQVSNPQRRHVFYFDPALNYALRRREEWSASGDLVVQSDANDFAKLSDRIHWLPKQCVVKYYTHETCPNQVFASPTILATYSVTELSAQYIPDTAFRLIYAIPGTFVADGRPTGAEALPNQMVEYRIPADPKRLDEVIESALAGRQLDPWPRSSRTWWWLLPFCAVISLAVIFWLRHR